MLLPTKTKGRTKVLMHDSIVEVWTKRSAAEKVAKELGGEILSSVSDRWMKGEEKEAEAFFRSRGPVVATKEETR